MADEILATGCVYGQYSSLDEFSYDVIRYVGMTATIQNKGAQQIANERLKVHLKEPLETTSNPAKVEWYRSVEAAGGHVLSHVLIELHDATRRQLGDLEHDWIEKLGGPVLSDGTVVQLFNLTHGRDGGWWTVRDDEWREAASQRMVEFYTEDKRREQSEMMKQLFIERPELRERWSEAQREAQNRPEVLEASRARTLALWQDPEYRAKLTVEKPCQFCGRIFHSYRSHGHHELRCQNNPDRDPGNPCVFCTDLFLDLDHHEIRCKENPDRLVELVGPRPKTVCPECGIECGVGAGLRAHVKWNHEIPIVTVHQLPDDLSTAQKKNWAGYTPEQREQRVKKTQIKIQQQLKWCCVECGLVTNAGPMVSHYRFSGHSGKTAVEPE